MALTCSMGSFLGNTKLCILKKKQTIINPLYFLYITLLLFLFNSIINISCYPYFRFQVKKNSFDKNNRVEVKNLKHVSFICIRFPTFRISSWNSKETGLCTNFNMS